MAGRDSTRSRRWSVGLAALWLLAVPAAAVLGVLGLRAAGAGSDAAAVISAADAVALAATASPAPSAGPTPTPTAASSPVPTAPPATPPAASVVERRVPGAVLGLRCDGAVPGLVWAVPEPGWVVEGTEVEDGLLDVPLEGQEGEVRVLVQCADGEPTVVGAERRGGRDD